MKVKKELNWYEFVFWIIIVVSVGYIIGYEHGTRVYFNMCLDVIRDIPNIIK